MLIPAWLIWTSVVLIMLICLCVKCCKVIHQCISFELSMIKWSLICSTFFGRFKSPPSHATIRIHLISTRHLVFWFFLIRFICMDQNVNVYVALAVARHFMCKVLWCHSPDLVSKSKIQIEEEIFIVPKRRFAVLVRVFWLCYPPAKNSSSRYDRVTELVAAGPGQIVRFRWFVHVLFILLPVTSRWRQQWLSVSGARFNIELDWFDWHL